MLLDERFEYNDLEESGWYFEDRIFRMLRTKEHGEILILLAPTPDIILEILNQKLYVDIILTGETHGGQVRLPFIGALYTGTRLGRQYSLSLFDFSGMYLYVNRGIGYSRVPFRFFCSPEITSIQIKSKSMH